MVTSALMGLLSQTEYARIIFTVSIVSYTTGATLQGVSYFDTYNGAKAALRTYANNLDAALRAGGSKIRVSTLNPYAMRTDIMKHPNPIYTQPVNDSGLSDSDPVFNAVVTQIRQLISTGVPTSLIGEACVQVLSMGDPLQNVAIGSPREPLATQGGNSVIESQILAENQTSAIPLRRA
jgi:short-subunit dehydrogenase